MLARGVAASAPDDDDGDDEELRCFDDRDGSGDARAVAPDSAAHAQRTARERSELVRMLLESVASVPVAIARIHENEKLLAALQQQMGGEQHGLLRQFFRGSDRSGGEDVGASGERTGAFRDDGDDALSADCSSVGHGDEEEEDGDASNDEGSDDESSGFGSDYEKDLAEAVSQLVMTDDALAAAMPPQLSAPIAIRSGSGSGERASGSSPHSSLALGASPGTLSQDGEPVSALWPRQPHQFAFTQEEEATARGEDEVYSEMISSMCEDESLRGEEEEDGGGADDDILEGDEEYDGPPKVFAMDDDDDDDSALDAHISGYRAPRAFADSALNAPADAGRVENGNEEENDDGSDDESNDEYEPEYEVVELRIIRERHKTGFEPSRDWRPRVELAIGEAVFSRTYKCVDTRSSERVCLKILKNNKEYFDQGVDEIRLLQYIGEHCDVDATHVVRLLDFFYFREHLIIVTELLRDNLYEFSKLLLARGVLNYFNMARLKKVAAALTSYVQSRSYRAPEVQLFTGDVLFRNDSEQTLLARIIAAVGPVPATLLAERADLHEQFRANELFAVDAGGAGVLAGALRLPALEHVVQTGDRLFLDFLRCLLRIDPAERLSAAQALAHPWLAG
ncbi:hypothetical protein PybrP1_001586 [[Pythium] brassicae (nom. inval.)]|nr:hypothetical protein PybrP1_001586 [[Pythium] brassicae (nom. inval.)]